MALSNNGDVIPVEPTEFPLFGSGSVTGDGSDDYLVSGGNAVITTGINQTDPTADTGTGIAWNSLDIYRAYEFPFPVVVGYEGAGQLGISASTDLRPENVIIGYSPGSYGYVSVGGEGTELNNDKDDLSSQVRRALALALEIEEADVVHNDIYSGDEADLSFDSFAPRRPVNANMWVGRKGFGALSISSGGKVTVRHRLLVGGYETAEDTLGTASPYVHDIDLLNDVARINSAGDLATGVAGPGGFVYVAERGTLVVTGITGDNRTEMTPPDPDDPMSSELSIPVAVGVAAIASVIFESGVMALEGGYFAPNGGLVNRGTLTASPSSSQSVVSIKDRQLTDGSDTPYTASGSFINEGLIYIRSGASLFIDAALENNGLIYIESGGILNTPDGITGTGEIKTEPCGPAATVIDSGFIRQQEKAAVLLE